MIKYCTVGNWAVSGKCARLAGYELHVHDVINRHIGETKMFNTVEEADAYCLAKGYIREYRREQ